MSEEPGGRSPRLDRDVFALTPSGWRELHGERDARDMDPRSYTSSTRAFHESDSEVAEQTEETTLEAFDQ